MWCAIAMPPYGGFFMAVDPLQKHIFRGALNGVLETPWQQMLAVCLFLATAALLMVVRVWLPPTFAGVDPEAQVSARMRHHGDAH